MDDVAQLIAGIAALPGGAGVAQLDLAGGVAAARERWSALPPLDASFAAYVVERAARQPDLAGSLARLRVDDLALAWWCSGGSSDAIAAFESALADDIRKLLARFHRLDADELRQLLRVKLFLDGRIRDYAGFGFLQNWFRVLATRTFLDAARAKSRERSDELPDAVMNALVEPGASPQTAAVRAQVVAALQRAIGEALATLPPRDRTFLRHVLIDRLTLEQIAATYKVHRVTVSRVVGAARDKLRELARASALDELDMSTRTLDSAVRDLDSALDVSLSKLFPER